VKTTTRRRLEHLEGQQDRGVPLVWIRICDTQGNPRDTPPPEGWDDAPEDMRQVINIQLIGPGDD
jgi:hypothetical protein